MFRGNASNTIYYGLQSNINIQCISISKGIRNPGILIMQRGKETFRGNENNDILGITK